MPEGIKLLRGTSRKVPEGVVFQGGSISSDDNHGVTSAQMQNGCYVITTKVRGKFVKITDALNFRNSLLKEPLLRCLVLLSSAAHLIFPADRDPLR